MEHLVISRLAAPPLLFRASQARRTTGDNGEQQLKAHRIQLTLQRDNGDKLLLSAAQFQVHNKDVFVLNEAVEISGPEFSVTADRLDITMADDDEFRLEMLGKPSRFVSANGDRLEAGRIIYDSRSREVVFPLGLSFADDRSHIKAGHTRLNLDTRELTSGAPPPPPQNSPPAGP